MLRRLDQPLAGGPLRYLRRRLAHYAIDTGHFVEQQLPERPRRSYPRELLADAAARSRSLGEMMQFMGVVPYDSAYRHFAGRLAHFGIDTSHFGEPADGDELRRAVAESVSIAGTVRAMGLPPSSRARTKVKEGIEALGLSTAHFTGQGHGRGRPAPNRRSADDILRRLPADAPRTRRTLLHRALQEKGMRYACVECGTGEVWQGRHLTLEIDHMNGDSRDNRLGNLRYLCPSCHSQTPTFSRPAAPTLSAGRRGRAQ